MNQSLDELWLEALEPKLDSQIVSYLKGNHPDYQETLERQERLTQRYTILISVLNAAEETMLNREEYKALSDYMANIVIKLET